MADYRYSIVQHNGIASLYIIVEDHGIHKDNLAETHIPLDDIMNAANVHYQQRMDETPESKEQERYWRRHSFERGIVIDGADGEETFTIRRILSEVQFRHSTDMGEDVGVISQTISMSLDTLRSFVGIAQQVIAYQPPTTE